MTEVAAAVVAALTVIVALVRETQHRRQRGDQITAETSVADATASEMIAKTVKGLLVVMEKNLSEARQEVAEVKEELAMVRFKSAQRERELQDQIDRLVAQVEILNEAKKRNGGP